MSYMSALPRISTRRGAGVKQFDEPDFANGLGLTEKIIKGNDSKRYKKVRIAINKEKLFIPCWRPLNSPLPGRFRPLLFRGFPHGSVELPGKFYSARSIVKKTSALFH